MKRSDAIAYFGSRPIIADLLGITQTSITTWGENIPDFRAYQLHDLSGGELAFDGSFDKEQHKLAKKYHEKAVADAEWKAKGLK